MSVTAANTALTAAQSSAPGISMGSVPDPNKNVALVEPTTRVYFQGPDGGIFERTCVNGTCNAGVGPLWYALPGTPLAAVSWYSGRETRVYYLDHDYKLQEYGQLGNPNWVLGGLGGMNLHAAPNASIAAVQFQADGELRLRVFFQEAESNTIQQVAYGSTADRWFRGETVSAAMSGTGMAAAVST